MKTKYRFFTVFAAVLALSFAGTSQRFAPELNGSMMPYDFSRVDSVTPWGTDMTPVFINYMARHGARFLSSAKKVEALRGELDKARAEGYLSAKGEEFLKLIEKVDSATAGNWGALDGVGIEEEKRLGREMVAAAPDLFKRGQIEAKATYVPRVVMTMYEVCHELARFSNNLEVATSEGRQYNNLLRFFTTDSAYVNYLDNGAWKQAYAAFVKSKVAASPAQGLFTRKMDTERMRKLTLDMYGVLQSLPAAGIEWMPGRWFTEAEYRTCWEAANLQHYYERSVSPFSTLPARSAVPLLRDIIATTDSAATGRMNQEIACLRFGHAETVMPLFSLMRLPGCYSPALKADEAAEQWRDWEVSPLGANLVIVLLRDGKGEPYLAMRLNGRWIAPAGGTEKVPPWEQVRGEWQRYASAATRPAWRPAPQR